MDWISIIDTICQFCLSCANVAQVRESTASFWTVYIINYNGTKDTPLRSLMIRALCFYVSCSDFDGVRLATVKKYRTNGRLCVYV